MSLKKIDAKLRTFTTNRTKLQVLGHEIAMMIFDHAKEHGDTSRALVLAKQMPKSWKSQLQNWFETFSPIRVIEKNDKHGILPSYKKLSPEEKEAAWKRDEADQTPFYLLEEPDPDVKTLDFATILKLIEGLGKRIEKKIEQGQVAEADVASAQAAARAVAGLKIERVPAANDAADPNNLKLVAANG